MICGGIKDDDGNWNVIGPPRPDYRGRRGQLLHSSPVFTMTPEHAQLRSSSSVASRPGTRGCAYASSPTYPKRLGDLVGQYSSTVMWDETNRVNDGTIRRETRFPASTSEWILSGPHIHIANPLFKTPRRVCTEKGHYDPSGLDDTTGGLSAAHQLCPCM